MESRPDAIRGRFDRAGIALSGLCAVHCVLGIALVSLFGLGGQLLLAPEIHQFGLLAAVAIGAVSLAYGVLRHRRPMPLIAGAIGLALMAAAIVAGHGIGEAILTIAGVSLVAAAHWRNLRHAR